MYMEEPSSFFPLLDTLATSEDIPPLERLSPEAIEEVVIQTAGSLGFIQDPGALESTKLQIALHAASPKIQAFYQFYSERNGIDSTDKWNTCGSWVDWYGERVCDSATLARFAEHDTIPSSESEGFNSCVAINNLLFCELTEDFASTLTPPRLLPIDHILPDPLSSLERPARTAIFYASVDSPNFRDLHSHLYKLASSPNPRLEYVFRHIPSPSTGAARHSFLSGYGVALDLKKTDYLVLDDRHSSSDGEHLPTSCMVDSH